MPKIQRDSLLTLEAYARQRNEFRARVIDHKQHRAVHLGESITLMFEDELTVRYQIQEMLRVERIYEERGIAEELSVYNPLVPDGRNLKATMMIEYPDPQERRLRLSALIGVEDAIWMEVQGCGRVWGIADEDLERGTDEKTSAVHFLRFEFSDVMAQMLKAGAELSVGVDHPNYQASVRTPPAVRQALAGDLA